MNKIRNFIFDFDGTIIDSKDLMIQIAMYIAPQINIVVSQSDRNDLNKFRSMSHVQIIKYFRIKLIYMPKIIKLFFSKYDEKIINIPQINGINGVLSFLNKNNNFLGILSTNSAKNIRKNLKRENIGYINDIYCLKGFYFLKNLMLLRFISKNKLKKSETIYIGDEVRDIEAAKKAGLISGAVLWGMNTKDIIQKFSPDFIFEKPDDILKLI